MRNGDKITMKKNNATDLAIENFNKLEWFRPPNAPDDDGRTPVGEYRLTRDLNLLNLGSAAVRNSIVNTTSLSKEDLNPDVQYSSQDKNTKIHKEIEKAEYFKDYDGTITTRSLIDDELWEDLEGADEIVIFTSRLNGALMLVSILG